MGTVKIVCADTAVGEIDNIPITPGTKNIGFDDEVRGGGADPIVNVAQGKTFAFRTPIVNETGLTMAKAFALLQTLDNVTLSAGTTGGDTDADVVGPCVIEIVGDGVQLAQITVTGNPAA